MVFEFDSFSTISRDLMYVRKRLGSGMGSLVLQWREECVPLSQSFQNSLNVDSIIKLIYLIIISLNMCYCPCCCAAPLSHPYPIIYTPATFPQPYPLTAQPPNQPPKPPPVEDQTWHHGYTCCNCQQCCDFRNCCDCSGFCYTYNVGANSMPFFNSPYGPLYEYYQNGCCRSCFAAQFSGASCVGSLLPCCCNTLYVVEEGGMTEMEMLRGQGGRGLGQAYLAQGTPTNMVHKPELFTVATGELSTRQKIQTVSPPLVPQVQPMKLIQPVGIPYANPGLAPSSQHFRLY